MLLDLFQYLEDNDGQRHLSTDNSYSEFYFGRNIAEQLPNKLLDLKTLLNSGNYKYIVMDFMSHRVARGEVKNYIENNFKPITSIKNDIGNNYFTLIESMGYRHFIKDYIENAMNDKHSAFIDIYDAKEILTALNQIN